MVPSIVHRLSFSVYCLKDIIEAINQWLVCTFYSEKEIKFPKF